MSDVRLPPDDGAAHLFHRGYEPRRNSLATRGTETGPPWSLIWGNSGEEVTESYPLRAPPARHGPIRSGWDGGGL